jgi:hypothetical protein
MQAEHALVYHRKHLRELLPSPQTSWKPPRSPQHDN